MSSFWTLRNVFSVRKLVLMGLFVALTALFGFMTIYVSDTFRLIGFAYLPGAVGSMLYGPWAGLVMGFAGDFVSYMVKPVGGYFFGYAISAMLQNFIYSIFLFRRPASLWRVAIAQFLVLVFIYMGLGYLWLQIMAGLKTAEFFTGARLVKNLIQYPIDTALLYGVLRLLPRRYNFAADTLR